MGPSRNCSRIKQGAALPNGLPPIAKQRTRNYTLAPGRVGYTRAIPKKRYHTDDAVGSRSEITPLTKMYIYIYIRIVVLSVDKVLSTEKSNFRKESRKFEFLAWNIVTIEWVSSEKRWGKRMYVNGWRYRIIAWERERLASARNFFLALLQKPMLERVNLCRVGLSSGQMSSFFWPKAILISTL